MCTAITFTGTSNYFGRNLDLNYSYGEQVVITPRNYEFNWRQLPSAKEHLALIGVGIVVADYPLYFDAINEAGLGMAGLNFPGNAYYGKVTVGKSNVSPFEFIPWLLGQAHNVGEARKLLADLNLVKINFSEQLPLADLHWLIADKDESIVVEATKTGLHIYDNPVGVLTNNPAFNYQLENLKNYRQLSARTTPNTFASSLDLPVDATGFGSIGLPGDLSPKGRFVRASFAKLNALRGTDPLSDVNQFFQILATVKQVKGLNWADEHSCEYTVYSDCYDLQAGVLYYLTYESPQLHAAKLQGQQLATSQLITYPLKNQVVVDWQN